MSAATTAVADERDLSFRLVENASPRTLSPEQIDAYNRDGCLKPFRIFDAL